jgi:DNA-binding LacI/PurR family transcriptional regulator
MAGQILVIVGFDDIDLGQFTQPPLTTLRSPRAELGRMAFNALHRILRGDSEKSSEYKYGICLTFTREQRLITSFALEFR